MAKSSKGSQRGISVTNIRQHMMHKSSPRQPLPTLGSTLSLDRPFCVWKLSPVGEHKFAMNHPWLFPINNPANQSKTASGLYSKLHASSVVATPQKQIWYSFWTWHGFPDWLRLTEHELPWLTQTGTLVNTHGCNMHYQEWYYISHKVLFPWCSKWLFRGDL